MPITVHQLLSAKGMGLFQGGVSPEGTPTFRRFNLIYGFNGSGKTTLSRIFRSLGAGVLQSGWDQDGSFRFELSDGRRIGEADVVPELTARIVVFNTDFVAENLRWREGSANPIFYIGQQQAQASRELESVRREVETLGRSVREAEAKANAESKSLQSLSRNAAREISEELGLGRRYVATHLHEDLDAQEDSRGTVLKEEERKKLLRLVFQQGPAAEIEPLNIPDLHLATFAARVMKIAAAGPGALVLSEFTKHPGTLKWVAEGLQHHTAEDLQRCLFCGGPLTETRVAEIEAGINGAVADIMGQANRLHQEMLATQQTVREFRSSLPSQNDVADHLRRLLADALAKAVKVCREVEGWLARAAELAAKKRDQPASVLPADWEVQSIAEYEREFAEAVEDVNQVIGQHNSFCQDFEHEKEVGRKRLKMHRLATLDPEYRKLKSSCAETEEDLKRLREQEVARDRGLQLWNGSCASTVPRPT